MRIKILALGLVCLLFATCYMNYAERIVYYPQTPDYLYDQILLILKDLGYTITSDEKTPDLIVSKHPYMIAEKAKHKAMITFRRTVGETEIEIHISQIGEKISKEALEKIRDEIAQNFKERIK